jgi:hypothetical protein
MDEVAREFPDALNREDAYSDVVPEDWEAGLKREGYGGPRKRDHRLSY